MNSKCSDALPVEFCFERYAHGCNLCGQAAAERLHASKSVQQAARTWAEFRIIVWAAGLSMMQVIQCMLMQLYGQLLLKF